MHAWLKKANPGLKFPEPSPGLPDPNQQRTPEAAERCAAANASIEKSTQCTPAKRKRGDYHDYDGDDRLKVARYANSHGCSAAAKKFSTPAKKINESTIRGWVKKFRKQLNTTTDPSDVTAKDMSPQPRGRPVKLGEILDSQVQEHIKGIRSAGGVVNRTIVKATGHGIVSNHNRSMLKEFGGTIDLDRAWAASIMRRMNFVRRKGTKAARTLPDDYTQQRERFLSNITETVKKYNIPDRLIVNFDQTQVKIVPVSEWTLNEVGAKQVDIGALDDKRAITALLGVNAEAELLPPQLIYQGTTTQCHPTVKFPDDWNITHSKSHWSTDETMEEYVDKVLVPYFDSVKEELDIPIRRKSLAIFDMYSVHRTDEFKQKLRDNHIEYQSVPGGCTPKLQPLDVSGNKKFKDGLKKDFNDHYSAMIAKELKAGKQPCDIKPDMRLATLKPLNARWVLSSFDQLRNAKTLLASGWKDAGITDAIAAAR